jgi:hypothetical protein
MSLPEMSWEPWHRDRKPVDYVVMSSWVCTPCDVKGRDPQHIPVCWNCGGKVRITARPTIPIFESDAA